MLLRALDSDGGGAATSDADAAEEEPPSAAAAGDGQRRWGYGSIHRGVESLVGNGDSSGSGDVSSSASDGGGNDVADEASSLLGVPSAVSADTAGERSGLTSWRNRRRQHRERRMRKEAGGGEWDWGAGRGTPGMEIDVTAAATAAEMSVGRAMGRGTGRDLNSESSQLPDLHRRLNSLGHSAGGGSVGDAEGGGRLRSWATFLAPLFSPAADEDCYLWTSPGTSGSGSGSGSGSRSATASARHKAAVVLYLSLLALGYSLERATLKVLIDKAGPFRLFGAEAISGLHAAALGTYLAGSAFVRWANGGGDGGGLGNTIGTANGRPKTLGLPVADVGLMAVLDTAHLLLLVISGSTVPPILTIVVVQLTIPITAFLKEFFHPRGKFRRAGGVLCLLGPAPTVPGTALSGSGLAQMPGRGGYPAVDGYGGQNGASVGGGHGDGDGADFYSDQDGTSILSWGARPSRRHVFGSALIFVAGTVSLAPALLTLADPQGGISIEAKEVRRGGLDPAVAYRRSAVNTVLYGLACVPAAASQLFKDRTLAHFHQPVDPNRLNFLLSSFQFVFVMIVSPLLYPLQGLAMGEGWIGLYPSRLTSLNFQDGSRCLLVGGSPWDEQGAASPYPEAASCDLAWLVLILHVLGILAVGFAVERIVEYGATTLLHRAITMGFALATATMYAYEVLDPSVNYGPVSHGWNLACAVLVAFGSEKYHRASTEQATFETTYKTLDDIYADEEDGRG